MPRLQPTPCTGPLAANPQSSRVMRCSARGLVYLQQGKNTVGQRPLIPLRQQSRRPDGRRGPRPSDTVDAHPHVACGLAPSDVYSNGIPHGFGWRGPSNVFPASAAPSACAMRGPSSESASLCTVDSSLVLRDPRDASELPACASPDSGGARWSTSFRPAVAATGTSGLGSDAASPLQSFPFRSPNANRRPYPCLYARWIHVIANGSR